MLTTRGELSWLVHYLDSSIVRAHQHAAGAKGHAQEALGHSQGGFSWRGLRDERPDPSGNGTPQGESDEDPRRAHPHAAPRAVGG